MKLKPYYFALEDKVASAPLSENPYCTSIAAAWILCESAIEDDALWLANECAYFGIDRDHALDAVTSGFVLLYHIFEEAYADRHTDADNQAREVLCVYYRMLLNRLDPDLTKDKSEYYHPRVLGALRTQLTSFYQDWDEKDVVAYHYLKASVTEDSWLNRMADAQRQMFADETEQAGMRVESLYNELFRRFLPEEMQDEQIVERIILFVAKALKVDFPEEEGIWDAVAESFIESIETEE